MKTSKNHKLILSVLVFFLTTACVYAYPPDNAAVLYYKAAMTYEVDSEMADMLRYFRKGKIELNDQIREFVKKNRFRINTILDASEVKNCDWGRDFTRGFEAEIPQVASMRKLARLVTADAKILAADGDYEAALSRCMSLYKMARHANDRDFLCYLVGVAINSVTNNCVIEIMSDMPQHARNMTRLKTDLTEIDSIPFSIKPALLGVREVVLEAMILEQIQEVVRLCDPNESIKKKLLSFDEAAIERNKKYFENYYAGVIAAYDMPYVQGYTAMENLARNIEKDFESGNLDATLTGYLAPATYTIFSLSIRFKTHNNAIKAAIELYLIKAKTGKLPDTLPVGLPCDLFSGKPFVYEKTEDGFILRCQGKNLGRDKIYEYEFKVSG